MYNIRYVQVPARNVKHIPHSRCQVPFLFVILSPALVACSLCPPQPGVVRHNHAMYCIYVQQPLLYRTTVHTTLQYRESLLVSCTGTVQSVESSNLSFFFLFFPFFLPFDHARLHPSAIICIKRGRYLDLLRSHHFLLFMTVRYYAPAHVVYSAVPTPRYCYPSKLLH